MVGGLDPCAIDRDPVRSLDALFALAERHGKPIDIHLHEPGEMGAFSLDLILDRTAALGMQGKVVVSHGFCLGDSRPRRDALIARMAKLGMAIITTRAGVAGRCRRCAPAAQAGVTVLWRQRRHPRHLDALRQRPTCSSARCLSACATTCAATTNSSRARLRHPRRRARLRLRGLRPGTGRPGGPRAGRRPDRGRGHRGAAAAPAGGGRRAHRRARRQR